MRDLVVALVGGRGVILRIGLPCLHHFHEDSRADIELPPHSHMCPPMRIAPGARREPCVTYARAAASTSCHSAYLLRPTRAAERQGAQVQAPHTRLGSDDPVARNATVLRQMSRSAPLVF